MGIYDSRNPYPKDFDEEIDTSDCDNCTFECWEVGYCIKDKD